MQCVQTRLRCLKAFKNQADQTVLPYFPKLLQDSINTINLYLSKSSTFLINPHEAFSTIIFIISLLLFIESSCSLVGCVRRGGTFVFTV